MDKIAAEALRSVRAGIDALLSCGLDAVTAPELTELLSALETQRRRLEAVDQRLLATMGERGVPGEFARSTTAELMVTLLRVSPREAKARVNPSLDMGPRRALTGEPLEPIFPLVAEAQHSGEISAVHASAVTTWHVFDPVGHRARGCADRRGVTGRGVAALRAGARRPDRPDPARPAELRRRRAERSRH